MIKKFLTFFVLALFVFAVPTYASAQRAGDKNHAGSKAKPTQKKDAKPSTDDMDFAVTVMRIGEAYQKKQFASALVYCEQAMDKIPPSFLNDEKDR